MPSDWKQGRVLLSVMTRAAVQVIVTLRGEFGSAGFDSVVLVFGSGTDCQATTLLPLGPGSPLTSAPMSSSPEVRSFGSWLRVCDAKKARANRVPVESFSSTPIGGSS